MAMSCQNNSFQQDSPSLFSSYALSDSSSLCPLCFGGAGGVDTDALFSVDQLVSDSLNFIQFYVSLLTVTHCKMEASPTKVVNSSDQGLYT